MAVLAGAAALASAGPGAAASWLPGTTLSAEGEDTVSTDLAVGAGGAAAMIWRANQYSPSSEVKAAVHEPGAAWSAPVSLAPGAYAFEPRIAVGADGSATATWLERDAASGSPAVVRAARRPAGGSWTSATTISSPTDNATLSLEVGVDAAGNAVVVWLSQELGQSTGRFMAALRRGGTWQTPTALGDPIQDPDQLTLDVAASGNATAAWVRSDGTNKRIVTTSLSTSGTWSAPNDLTFGGVDTDFPRVAVDAQGDATLVWRRRDNPIVVQAATRAASGDWTSPTTVSNAAEHALGASVDVDAAGNATAAWRSSGSDPQQLVVADRPAGGAWTAPTVLTSDGRNGFEVAVARSSSGQTALAWRHASTTFTSAAEGNMQALVRPAGGTWSAITTLFPIDAETYDPLIGTDDAGNVVTAWRRSTAQASASVGTPYAAEARAFDAAGPQFTSPGSLSVPATSPAGVPAAMQAAPVDAWSGPATAPTWDFGDGATATGAAVQHAYATAGTYTVTVRSTDQRGLLGSAQRTIRVSGAPGTGGSTTPASAAFTVRGRTATFNVALRPRGAGPCPAVRRLTITLRAPKPLAVRRRALKLRRTGKRCQLTGTITLRRAVRPGKRVRGTIRHARLASRTLSTRATK